MHTNVPYAYSTQPQANEQTSTCIRTHMCAHTTHGTYSRFEKHTYTGKHLCTTPTSMHTHTHTFTHSHIESHTHTHTHMYTPKLAHRCPSKSMTAPPSSSWLPLPLTCWIWCRSGTPQRLISCYTLHLSRAWPAPPTSLHDLASQWWRSAPPADCECVKEGAKL